MDQWTEAVPQYEHIRQNDFSYRKHKKQKEEDIAVCECKFDANDPESACGERCLNFLTSTECTPGYCPCGVYCRNQRFQKCEYAKTRLYKTESCGWGLLADEDIKAGQFVIEYCGEVISRKKARRRSHTYEKQGLTDAYIISLNSSESIDATKRGSLARFINHSCQPNCETRKWNALGEIRVGIFAKQDISVGTELLYNYNFEWYGGAKVRCLCGAASCSGFLGAKSRGFQENTYLWEDDDDRIQAFPTSFHSTSDSLYNSNFRCSFHPETIDICSRLSHSTEIKASQSSQGAPTKMEHQVFYDLGKDDELSSSSDTQANSQDVILKTIPLSSAQMQEEFHVVNEKTDKMYSLLGDLEKTSEKYYKLKMAAKDENKKKNVQEQPETIYMDEEIDNSTRLEDEIGQISFTFDHENTERSSVVCKPPTLHPQKIKDPDFDSVVRFNFHKDPKELVDAVENQFVADEAKSDVNENNSDELNVSMVEEREREVISSLKKLKNTMDYQDVYDHGNDNRLACSPESQANSQDVILKTVASFSVQMQESFHVVNGKIDKTCTLLGDLEKTSEKYYSMKLAAKDENKKNVEEQPETIYKDENIDNIIGLEDEICQVSFSFAHENTERSSIVYKPPSLPPQKLKDPDFDSSVRFNFHKDTKEMAGVLENQFVADKGNSDVNENKFDELNVSMVEKREHKIISSGEELKNMKIDATDKEIKRLHQQNFPSRDPLGMDHQDAYDHGKDEQLSSSSESQANSQDVILKTVAFFSAQMQEEFNVVNEKVDKTYTRLGDLEKTSNTYYTMMAAKDENIKKNVQEQLETVHKDEEINNNTGLEDKFGQVSLSFDYENSKRSSVVNKPPTLPILKVKDPDFDSFPRLNFHKDSNEMADVENQSVVDEGKSHVDENKFDELNFAIVEKRECEVISSREKLLDLKKINATDKEIERLQLQQNFPFCDQLQMDHQDANDRGKNDELASSSESQANSQDVILKTVAFFSVQVQEEFNVVNEKIDKTYACLGDLEKTSEKYYTMKMAAKDGNKKKNGQEQQERIYMNEEVDKNTGLEGEIGQVNFENKSDESNVAMVEKREREKLKNMQEDVEILVEDHKRRKVTTSLVFPLY